jgi:hypothetical protein
MANTIILKRSATPGKVPTTSQLALGEIAINTYDGLIYIKKDDGTPSVVQIGGVTSVAGKTGAVVLDTSDVSEGLMNQYFTTLRARAAVSAGTGISYNNSTGVISTSQNLSTSGTPSFAGLSMFGDINMSGNIIPTSDIAYDLGSPTAQWKDIYVGPGSLYVNGQKVLQDDTGTITFSADEDQNIRIKTLGNGILQLGSSSTTLQVDSTLQLTAGKRITSSDGVKVQFGDDIEMNNNKVVGLGAPSANSDAATKKYVDDSVNAISTSSITQGNSSVAVVDSGTGTVTVTVDGTTALTVDANGVTVAGNFTVSGTQTVVNSNTINLADNIITLNSDATGAPTQNAGLLIERGDEADTQIRWNEGTDKWTFTNDGSVYYPMAVNTDDLAEGSTNQYHTTARARGAISASSSSGVSYNSTTGAISLGSIPNSSLANNSITINGTSVALGGTRTLDTDAVGEGSTNVYFTNARARSAVSAGTGISYNSTTGAISTSAIPNASLANSAVTVGTTSISLGGSATTIAGLTSVTSTGFTGALTGNASTATTLQTARAIQGVNFDGSAAITVVTAGTGITVTGTAVAVDSTIATKSYVDSAVQGKDNTDEITEGSTNLFFTNARARGAVSAGGSLSYNSSTGVFSYTTPSTSGITEGTNLYYTDARARAAVSFTAGSGAYNSSTGVITIPTNTNQLTNGANFATTSYVDSAVAGKDNTSEITEGTNLYYTDARARNAVSAGTGISYNSSTGVITNTITQYTDAMARATNSVTTGAAAYNSSTGVITIPGTTAHISESGNLFYTDARARAAVSFTAGSGAYNSSTGVITIPTNNNQIANGAGYITGITSANVTGALGYTPYNSSNPSGYVTSSILASTHTGALSTSSACSTGALTVSGAITATGEITAYFSDANLKKDIVEIEDPIAKLMSIRGVTFRPNETALALGITDKEEVGVIAQEVEAVLPQLVTPSAFAGYKTVKYDKLTALLVEAVKAQQLQIDALRAEIAKLGGSATTEL